MKFFTSPAGKIVAAVMVVGALAFLAYRFFAGGNVSEAASRLNARWFVCTETGKPYQVDLADVSEVPAYSPHSRKNTGQPAELCFWTADGKPKDKPTPVLLNKYAKGGEDTPTFCPDCGRLVEERNPGAEPGRSAPPTKAEYEARHNAPRN